MNAMENASKNAGEMLDKLTLEYNKARQAKITLELCEIISGAAAVWIKYICIKTYILFLTKNIETKNKKICWQRDLNSRPFGMEPKSIALDQLGHINFVIYYINVKIFNPAIQRTINSYWIKWAIICFPL